MNQPLKEWWIRTSADVDKAMEKQAVNVLLSWFIIFCWWLYVSSIILFSVPLSYLVRTFEEETSGLKLIGGICLSLVGLLFFKGEAVRNRTIGLSILWALLLFCLYNIHYTDSELPPESAFLADTALGLWRIHPALLAGWFALQAVHVLHLVFVHQRAKLKPYWILFLGGMLLLAALYTVSPALGLLYALLFPHETFLLWLKTPSDKDVVLAGSTLSKAKDINYRYRKQLDAQTRSSKEAVIFGGVNIPIANLTTHVMVIGSAGSGKSLTLKLLMQGCLPLVSPVTPQRAVVFDPKRNAYPDIMGMDNISAEVIILNPFDRRAAAYFMADDFTTYTHAESLAEILVPQPKGSTDPIWYLAPRSLLVGILVLFMENAPQQWRFSDLIRACDSLKLLTALLNSSEATKRYTEILGSEKTAINIYSSLRAEMDKFRSTAALWDSCSSTVSISQWLKGGEIWLLGENEEARPAMKAINSLILTRMSQMLLAEGDCNRSRTFIFLDELQSIHVESLQEIATKGRSKGICLMLAFQSILGMHDMYGKEVTESMLSQCRLKGFLKQSDQDSSRWSAQAIGDTEIKRQQATNDYRPIFGHMEGINLRRGSTEVIQQKNLVLPSGFINIPPINADTNQGMTGYYQVIDCHKHYESWQSLKKRLQPASEYVADFEPAPVSNQKLKPWTKDDWQRLGITKVMEALNHDENDDLDDDGGWL